MGYIVKLSDLPDKLDSIEPILDKVVEGDCLELMKKIPKDSIDLTLTDPPYGLDVDYGGYLDTSNNLKCLVSNFAPLCISLSRRTLVTCGITNIQLYPKPDWILCWHCPGGSFRGPWGFICWTPVLAYGKCPYLENGNGCRPDTFSRMEVSEKLGHPVTKPIGVWSWFMKRASLDKEVVFDPFLGSGTTAVAAKKLGRHFIGCEINPDYCKIAERRLLELDAQPGLFK